MITDEAASRMRESLDIETRLQAAVDEIQQAFGLDRAVVRLAKTKDR